MAVYQYTSTNKFRPHLSPYITIQASQERAVLVCEWSI